jgi:hypothetical protein
MSVLVCSNKATMFGLAAAIGDKPIYIYHTPVLSPINIFLFQKQELNHNVMDITIPAFCKPFTKALMSAISLRLYCF